MNVKKSGKDYESVMGFLFRALPLLYRHHAPGSEVYTFLKKVARQEVEALFSVIKQEPRSFGPFGKIVFPYYNKMGAVDSLNLFDLDELIIFSFCWANRKRYRYVMDIGANIGLHSIILDRCGFNVRAYEPDPTHFKILRRNLKLNRCHAVEPSNAAISNRNGTMEFIRVLGNTTGSHLVGSKARPYGKLERLPVRVEDIKSLITRADLVKIDAEGHEKEILLATDRNHWQNTDGLVEIENRRNAAVVYRHLKNLGVNLFSQKTNWQRVLRVDDIPTSYREGTLFVTCKNEMPWKNESF